MRTKSAALALGLALVAAAPAAGEDVDPAETAEAIRQGVAWLKEQQGADGSFVVPSASINAPGGLESNYPFGTTALATLALLKCGAAPDDPAVVRAFEWMYARPLEKTYEVSVLLLAIEARYVPPADVLERYEERRGYRGTVERHFGREAERADEAKVQEIVDWLVAHQQEHVWRYPRAASDGAAEDNSNTQYVVLALKGAARLGADVPIEVWEKVADYFVADQDPDGEAVEDFPVPAADGAIEDWKKPSRRSGGTRERGAGGTEARGMRARGWGYLPRPKGEEGGIHPPSSGAMTASGVAALCIAKSELERRERSWEPRQGAVEQAIRDGCAWLSRHWRPDANPLAIPRRTAAYKYYYLYGVERAGVLAGTYRFGPVDWWDEGAEEILSEQTSAGFWPNGRLLSRFANTCFALLFLRRATVPLVELPPKRPMTGGDDYDDRED